LILPPEGRQDRRWLGSCWHPLTGTVFARGKRGGITVGAVTSSMAVPHLSGVLTTVDYVVIALILLSMALGFWTGFVWQFVRIAGLLASLWVSWLYYPTVSSYLPDAVPGPVRDVVAAAAVFVGALMVCHLVAFLFHDLVDALKPEMPDRILGAVFGLIKGVLVVGFIAFLMMRFLPAGSGIRERVVGSRGAVAAASCVKAILHVLPQELTPHADTEQPT
jgi:membrane protein required for colicin V production